MDEKVKEAKRAFYEGLRKYFDEPMKQQIKETKKKFRQGLKLRFTIPKGHKNKSINSADISLTIPPAITPLSKVKSHGVRRKSRR